MKSSSRAVWLAFFGALWAGCGGCRPEPTPAVDAGVTEGLDASVPEQDAGTQPQADAGVDAGLPPLKINRLLPPRGGSSGGTQVLLQGSGFVLGVAGRATEAKKVTSIKFGSNVAIDFQVIDDQTIDVRVPPGFAGPAHVTLTNPRGSFVCNSCFTYFDELYLSQLQPKEGPLSGGNEVTLNGQGFTSDLQILFGTFSSPRVTFVSSTQVKAVVPRGASADLVDLTAYNKNGVGTLRRQYQYVADLRVSSVSPPQGPLAGGTTVVITGQGFDGLTALRFGAADAQSFTVDSPTQVTAVSPAALAAGPVDLVLTTPRESWKVKQGFTYADPAGSFDAFALSPRLGPASGGNTVLLTGQGLDQGTLTVTIGGQAATVGARTATTAEVTVPARGSAPRLADVVVSDGAGTRTLQGGYTYRLELSSVSPAQGPAAGGTVTSIGGAQLPPDVEVFFGALMGSTNGNPTETQASSTTPAGSGGAAVALRARAASDWENEALLPSAFTFLEELSVGRVHPDRGAIAGGTLVTVLGSGFSTGTVVSFGADRAKDVKIVDSHTLTCRTPKAVNVGTVDVKVEKDAQTDTLPGGFSYFDPRSVSGGLSGGPLVGTVNVTVLDGTPQLYGTPVQLATVMLGTDVSTPFQGLTDARGQITFSDPSLVKAQTVTVFKEFFESATVTAVNAENLTVYIARTGGGGDPSPSSGGGLPPPSVISGKVTGFKPPRPLTANETMEARVFVANPVLFYEPPFAGTPDRAGEQWIITQDNGGYRVFTNAGLHAVYAYLGVANKQTGAFTPYLMGIRRGITTSPDEPATNQNIVLDMHLDLTIPVTIDNMLSWDGQPGVNSLYGWIDLGSEGFIANPYNTASGPGGTGTGVSSISSDSSPMDFPGFPRLDGTNFIFVNEALDPRNPPSAVSYYFRRQPGDLSSGLTVGPMLPTPNVVQPNGAQGFTGTISWTRGTGPLPDIINVEVRRPSFPQDITVWSVVLPGTESSVTLPQPAVQKLKQEEQGALYVRVWSSRNPKFAYNQWTYDSLSPITWSSFTLSFSEVFLP